MREEKARSSNTRTFSFYDESSQVMNKYIIITLLPRLSALKFSSLYPVILNSAYFIERDLEIFHSVNRPFLVARS